VLLFIYLVCKKMYLGTGFSNTIVDVYVDVKAFDVFSLCVFAVHGAEIYHRDLLSITCTLFT